MIDEGDQVPALMATLSDGRSINLAAPGAPLVLYFYPKDDTSGCTREAQDFTALADDFAAAGAMVVGVSRDEMKKHDKFIAKYDLAVPLASDADGADQRRLRDVGPEVDVRPQIYGDGARDLPDRCRRPGGQGVAQGQGAGPCRGDARGGARALVRHADGSHPSAANKAA